MRARERAFHLQRLDPTGGVGTLRSRMLAFYRMSVFGSIAAGFALPLGSGPPRSELAQR